jgi:hypothetical protein
MKYLLLTSLIVITAGPVYAVPVYLECATINSGGETRLLSLTVDETISQVAQTQIRNESFPLISETDPPKILPAKFEAGKIIYSIPDRHASWVFTIDRNTLEISEQFQWVGDNLPPRLSIGTCKIIRPGDRKI